MAAIARSAQIAVLAVRDAFLDTTFLADRSTTLREHLERNPSLMQDEPPPALKSRYSG